MATRAVEILINGRDNATQTFNRVRGGLDSLKTSVVSLKGALAGLAAGFALKAAFGSIKSSLEQTAAHIDAVAKHASKIGVTVEALSGLHHAAKEAGMSTTNLDLALQRMTRRVAEVAQTGGGPAASALEQLGLSAQRLSMLSPDKQLEEIADAMQGVTSQSERVRLAFKLFDSGGVGLVNALSKGSAGLREMADQAKALGLSFTTLDAAKVEAANGALDRMKDIWEGIKRTIVIELAPFVEALAAQMTKLAESGGGLIQWIPSFKSVGTAIGIVADVVDVLYDGFLALQAGVTKGLATQLRSWSRLGHGIQAVVNLLPGVKVTFADTLTAMADDLDKLASEQWENAKQKFMKAPPSEGIKQWFEDVENSANEAAAAIAKATEERQRLAAQEQLQTTAQGALDQVTGGLTNLWGSLSGAATKFGENVAAGLKKGNEKALEELEKRAASIREKNMTPQEIFEREMESAREALKHGLLSPEIFAREQERLQQQLKDSTRVDVQQQQIDPQVSTSRFLTRVPGAADPQLAISKNTEETAKGIKALRALVLNVDQAIRENKIVVRQLGFR